MLRHAPRAGHLPVFPPPSFWKARAARALLCSVAWTPLAMMMILTGIWTAIYWPAAAKGMRSGCL